MSQHLIGQAAECIFRESVSSWAQANAHRDGDYAIDFTAEVFVPDSGVGQRAAGYDFQVQVKGTEVRQSDAPMLAFVLRTEDLAHYLDNKRVPVFLVVVDVPKRRGWWLFLQEYTATALAPTWRIQKTVTVRLPREQTLGGEGGFRAAVIRSAAWMQERWPGSPQAALAAEKRRLEAIDPRVEASVSAEPGVTKVEIRAKQPIPFAFRIHGPIEARREFRTRLGFGTEVNPEEMGVEVRVEGLPIVPEGPLQGLRIGGERDVTVSLVRRRGEVESVIEIPTKFTIGPLGMRGQARLGKALMELTLSIGVPKDLEADVVVSWSFCSDEWQGKDVLGALPEFDRLNRLFGGIEVGDALFLHLMIEGCQFAHIPLSAEFVASLAKGYGFIEIARRIRTLFGPLGRAVPFPESMTDEECLNLHRLWEFRHGRTVEEEITNLEMNVQGPRDMASHLVRSHNHHASCRLPCGTLRIHLWGSDFDVAPVGIEIPDGVFELTSITDLYEPISVAMGTLRLKGPARSVFHPFADREKMLAWIDAGKSTRRKSPLAAPPD